MKSRKFRLSQCLSPAQILAKVKRQMCRQKQYQKIQQNLLYLNNSFSNNLQCEQIYIDICKSKKKNIKSRQLKGMYTLFSQNKANLCIFEKIVSQQLEKIKIQKQMNESSFNKWCKDTKGLMQIIQQEQTQTQKQIRTNSNLNSTQQLMQSTNTINQSNVNINSSNPNINTLSQNIHKSSKSHKNSRSSINIRNSLNQQLQQEKQLQFLVKRIYCRLIQKILVKIAFYTLNNKFLDFLAINILQLTKNLQVMIRRLNNIKDLRLLHQIILKVYRQNLIIQNKIYQILIENGYIVSIDQFYRVNGIDVDHKDIYERNDNTQQKQKQVSKKAKMTLKQKIMKMKQKKQKQNVVKKQYIDRTNNQIHQKYLYCVDQIKNIIHQEDQQEQNEKNSQQKQKRKSTDKQKQIQNNSNKKLAKTQSYFKRPSNLISQKPSRFSNLLNSVDLISQNKKQHSVKSGSQPDQNGYQKDSIDRSRRNSKQKSLIHYKNRLSIFSPQFAKLIKNSARNSQKFQRNSVVLSQKFLQFNQFQKGKRKQSRTDSFSNHSQIAKQKFNNRREIKKKSQEIFSTFAINKLLKLYQARNTDRYSVDSFLGSHINLTPQIRQSLKQQLLKLQWIYQNKQTKQKRQTKQSLFQSQRKAHLRSQSMTTHMSKKLSNNQHQQNITQRSQNGNKQNENRKVHFSTSNVALKKQSSYKQDQNQKFIKDQIQNKMIEQTIEYQTDQQNQSKVNQNIKQTSLIKLAKNRLNKLNKEQKITSTNWSIFTPMGVKNLISNTMHEQVPLKNEKLKKIPYLKVKNNNQPNNFNTQTHNLLQKTISQYQNKESKCPKLYKKVYQNQYEYAMNIKQKQIEEIVNQSIQQNGKSLIKDKIMRRGNSLHQMPFMNENIRNQREQRFRTFYPKFMNKTVYQNNNLNNKLQIQRSKKFRTTIHHPYNSQPTSPGKQQNKQNRNNNYQVYDIRKRRKIII